MRNLIFQVISGLKGQKMAQNDKKVCPSHSVSQEPYIIWSWCLVHLCKMIIFPTFFAFFQNCDFWVFWVGGKTAKNDPKLPISHSMSQELWVIWRFLVHSWVVGNPEYSCRPRVSRQMPRVGFKWVGRCCLSIVTFECTSPATRDSHWKLSMKRNFYLPNHWLLF